MNTERLRAGWETLEGEHLKTAAELALHGLAKYHLGEPLLYVARGGERVEDPRLETVVAGLPFENPVMVGAGWDKRGWAVDGLYDLGFSGVEVGSVLVHPQAGNPRPRLWYKDGVGRNALGFNSRGMVAVADYLGHQDRSGIVGISLGKNKLTPDEQAPWGHAAVAEHLHEYADYFVINVSSPNTPGLRGLLDPKPLAEIVLAVQEVLERKGDKPLFIKTTADLAREDLYKVLRLCVEMGVGNIHSNTTIDNEIKARYGWAEQPGGVSGDDPTFRKRANDDMKFITRETRGTGMQRISAGGINNTPTAVERMEAGAQAFQIVTGIRQRGPRIARDINLGILATLDSRGMKNASELVGIAA
jgi:dihydroorotate dehydrogenase